MKRFFIVSVGLVITTILLLLLRNVVVYGAEKLPRSYEKVTLGMTKVQLKKADTKITKCRIDNTDKKSLLCDHFEHTNRSLEIGNVEYALTHNRVDAITVTYSEAFFIDNHLTRDNFVREAIKKYGPPDDKFIDDLLGAKVYTFIWKNTNTNYMIIYAVGNGTIHDLSVTIMNESYGK